MQTLAIFTIGFSIFSALLLSIAHFNCVEYKDKLLSRLAGIFLLATLTGLQFAHYHFIMGDSYWISSPIYALLLFCVAPCFYFFSRPLLTTDPISVNKKHLPFITLLHFTPPFVALFIPPNITQPLAFLIGTIYVAWVALMVYKLRAQRNRFKQELLALGIIFFIALMVIIIGFIDYFIETKIFYLLYAISIGSAFFTTHLTLIRSPNITIEVKEAAQVTYASSTLTQIDCDKVLVDLKQLMEQEKLYINETINLAEIATQLKLTPHQLSELINSKLNKGFSRFIREYRIAEAKQQLIDEPKASVLSIGLSVGFTSQSNFYNAFKEITNMAPGQFRKNNKG
ncbi:MAG: AraC family transcriptional regulator [Cocleimonas sp.]|nr:AraC family transcriptional regulator [Cocleimonas sp.]